MSTDNVKWGRGSARVDGMPFGGVKNGGFGWEGPAYAIRVMAEERLVTIAHWARG